MVFGFFDLNREFGFCLPGRKDILGHAQALSHPGGYSSDPEPS
jgi:hypothetical protein